MILKSSIKPKKINMVNVKFSDQEKDLLKKKAKQYTGGNVSEWIRYAALRLNPPQSDLV